MTMIYYDLIGFGFYIICSDPDPSQQPIGDSDSNFEDEDSGSMWEVPAESIESDMELQLHVLGFKSIWTQRRP